METATQQSLIEAAKYITAGIIGSIVSPVVLSRLNRKRHEAVANKNNAESAVIDADAAKKIADTAAAMLVPLYQQLNLVANRLSEVEKEKSDLRSKYEEVLGELNERKTAEGKLSAEIVLIREENRQIREENDSLRKAISRNTSHESGQRSS